MPVGNISNAMVGIYSLAGDTKNPIPHFEFDLNSFRDPLGNLHLRKTAADGTDLLVQAWIKDDPRYGFILNQCLTLVKDHVEGGGKWISIGFRDHHGTWISRAIACLVAAELGLQFHVGVLHAKGQD